MKFRQWKLRRELNRIGQQLRGIPEFFIEHAELFDAQGQSLATLELFPAVSENPSLGFDLLDQGATRLTLRDNNGNQFDAAIE